MRRFTMLALAATVVGGLSATVPAYADQPHPDHKVTICHGAVDHYELITIDAHAMAGHQQSHGWQNLPDVDPDAITGLCPQVGGPVL
jgi:hypothetical protein